MVGVAGRSKGCNTCKKRKIACGLERPQCVQCIKSNRVCAGYQRKSVFIINQGHEDVLVDSTAEKPRPPDFDTEPAQLSKPRKVAKSKGRRSLIIVDQTTPSSNFSLVPAYRQMLIDTFIRNYLPIEQLGVVGESPWILLLADMADPTEALNTAFLAIALAKVGKVHGNRTFQKESLRLYTEGLWDLQKALWDPELMYRDETLAACLLLALYELAECPNGSRYGYASHHDGCAKLVRLRGPEAHTTGLGHATFLVFRMQGILQALDRHSSSFLTDPEWTEVPWREIAKTSLDRMWDIVASAPEFLKRADRFKDMSAPAAVLNAVDLIQGCWEMDAQLQEFYRRLEDSIPGPLYWPELSTKDNPADDSEQGKVFPVAFHFCNLRMAYTLMLYWATSTMLWNGMHLLYQVLDQLSFDREEIGDVDNLSDLLRVALPDCSKDCPCKANVAMPCITRIDTAKLPSLAHCDFLAAGRNVCQSVEYCMQDHMLDFGSTCVVAPLSIVVETLRNYPHCSRETAWGQAILISIQERYLLYLRHALKQ